MKLLYRTLSLEMFLHQTHLSPPHPSEGMLSEEVVATRVLLYQSGRSDLRHHSVLLSRTCTLDILYHYSLSVMSHCYCTLPELSYGHPKNTCLIQSNCSRSAGSRRQYPALWCTAWRTAQHRRQHRSKWVVRLSAWWWNSKV